MRSIRSILSGAMVIGLVSSAADAQDKLPGILTTNPVLVGQLYGCISRVENYVRISASLPDARFKAEDAIKVASGILGADISMMKADLARLKSAFPAELDVQKFDALMLKISQVELKEPNGYPWAQSASCAFMIHKLGLYEKYPFSQN